MALYGKHCSPPFAGASPVSKSFRDCAAGMSYWPCCFLDVHRPNREQSSEAARDERKLHSADRSASFRAFRRSLNKVRSPSRSEHAPLGPGAVWEKTTGNSTSIPAIRLAEDVAGRCRQVSLPAGNRFPKAVMHLYVLVSVCFFGERAVGKGQLVQVHHRNRNRNRHRHRLRRRRPDVLPPRSPHSWDPRTHCRHAPSPGDELRDEQERARRRCSRGKTSPGSREWRRDRISPGARGRWPGGS